MPVLLEDLDKRVRRLQAHVDALVIEDTSTSTPPSILTPAFVFVGSCFVSMTQVKREYPTSFPLTILRELTGRWPHVQVQSLASFGGSGKKLYAQLTARIGITGGTPTPTMNLAMWQACNDPSGSPSPSGGIGWTASPTTPTVVTAGSILSSTEQFGVVVHQTPILEMDLFTAHPSYDGQCGMVQWTDDTLQGFVLCAPVAVWLK